MRASTILAIAFIIVITILLSPLLMFAIEASRNPPILVFQVNSKVFNETHVLLTIEVLYGGSIPITELKLELMRRTLDIGDLQAGDVKSVTTIVSIEEISGSQQMVSAYRFRILGLYGIEVKKIG